MNKVVVVMLMTLSMLNCQSDGNPWKWGRERRCDATDYDPPCGLCEGIGGLAWGDGLNQFKPTTCKVIATPDQLTEKDRTEYPRIQQQVRLKTYEILIGDKTNPFCIGSFPGPDSTKNHCYQRQQGYFTYDWNNYRIRMDYNVKGTLFNTTSTIYHQKADMWILNDIKIGTQCVCADPGRSAGIVVYPVIPNFMEKDSKMLGREQIWVEFMNKEMILDHWVKGPHHIWKDPETGYIVRMWQPWNGLSVWDPQSFDFDDHSDMFQIPPPQCKSGLFRIKCDSNGYPKK